MGAAAVLFDLDGTLVDSERHTAAALTGLLARVGGIALDDHDRHYVIGHGWAAIHAHLRARYPRLPLSLDELVEQVVAERDPDGQLARGWTLPGAVEAVRRIAAPRALVTGSSRREAGQVLAALGLTGEFTVVVGFEDVGFSKPHPAGYLRACETLGVDPRRSVVIEDSAAGIAAGRDAGAAVVAVRAGNFAGQDQSQAHRIIDSLHHLTWELVDALAEGGGNDYREAMDPRGARR
jgi:HAD superfamily hydrolase (TIGR01509 family)